MYKFQEHKGFLWLKIHKIICKFLVFFSWLLIFKSTSNGPLFDFLNRNLIGVVII